MVAKTIPLPNIKELFIPDPGYIICDSDLAQADAQVVAWEADDDDLKAIFRDPNTDLHDENAHDIFGRYPKHSEDPIRKMAKAGVHATNYAVAARTLATTLGITVKEAEYFINTWFAAHPGIKDWHHRVEASLQSTRSVSNAFGYKRFYFDRIDMLLPQALAWIPQSTVALIINKALQNIYNDLYPAVQPLLQVHDSIVYQLPAARQDDLLRQIRPLLQIVVPYPDPLIIPADVCISSLSWADCKNHKIGWPEAA